MTNPPRGCVRTLCAALALLLVHFPHALLSAQETRSAAAAAPAAGKLSTTRQRIERLPVEPAPSPIEAGVISRAALDAVLASGIGRFLQQVRAEPALSSGRFVGWRVVTLFPGHDGGQVSALRPGDLVIRVNDQRIERPEQFKKLWDSLADAHEIVLDIQRDGKPSRLRYAIEG